MSSQPTTCPELLIAQAALDEPPSVPRSSVAGLMALLAASFRREAPIPSSVSIPYHLSGTVDAWQLVQATKRAQVIGGGIEALLAEFGGGLSSPR